MRNSSGFRQGILKRALPPVSLSFGDVSHEAGISRQMIRSRMEMDKDGRLGATGGEIPPGGRVDAWGASAIGRKFRNSTASRANFKRRLRGIYSPRRSLT